MKIFHETGPAKRRLPPLKSLIAFEAAARRGTFALAAQELSLTPSAISHQVRSLEAFLGVRLFRRERRQAQLTIAGMRYLEAVGSALDEIDLATRRMTAASRSAVLNVSVAPAFLTRWLVPKVGDFQSRHPDIELRLSPNNGSVDFESSDIDMAIYFGDGQWPDVETFYLREVVAIAVCSPGYLAASPPLTKPEDLGRHALIDVSTRPGEWEAFLANFGVSRPASAKRLAFTSTALALGAAIEDLGVALADRELAAREVESGRLQNPLGIELTLESAYYLVYEQGRRVTDTMQAFIDWVLERIAEQPRAPSSNR